MNKKEKVLIFLGYLTYLTVFFVPLFLLTEKLTRKNYRSGRFKEHYDFLLKTFWVNIVLISAFLICSFLATKIFIFNFIEFYVFSTVVAVFFFNFLRGFFNFITSSKHTLL